MPDESITHLLENARIAASRGEYDRVITCLQRILEQKPLHTVAHAHLAWIYTNRGLDRLALHHYVRVLLMRPWILQIYFRIGQSMGFLLRRWFSKQADSSPILSKAGIIFSTGIGYLCFVLTFLLEKVLKRSHTITHWMKHHQTAQRYASINPYEYYKITEIFFADRCIQQTGSASILDMGSGFSGFPSFLASRGHVLIAFDLERHGLEQQKRLAETLCKNHLFAISGDFTLLPFLDESLDAITLISSIEHIPEQGDINTLSHVKRILKQDGDLVITVPVNHVASEQWTTHQIGHIYQNVNHPQEAKGFLRVYNPETLYSRLIHPSHMKLVELSYYGERTQMGWMGLGRNFIDHRGSLHPSPFLAPLNLLFTKKLQECQLPQAHWAVACIHLKKENPA